ncbi:MAG: hypothetical protein ACJ8R9_02475 [Steroidobacteraceae bacterium]
MDSQILLSPEEEFIKAVLEHKGAAVTPIPRKSEQTPDFDVQFGGVNYIVEVKTRGEAEERAEARRASFLRGDVHGDSEELKRKNTISSIIESGVVQLKAYGQADAMRVLWVHCSKPFGERYKEQFFNAFYGSTLLFDLDDRDYKVEGIYFRDSDFFRYRATLDGAVITMDLGGGEVQIFCLANDQSAKYEAFRGSPLPQAFPVGFYDPAAKEAAGEAVVIRGAFDRRNANVVLAHLHQLTGRKIFNMDLTHASATVAIPRGGDP